MRAINLYTFTRIEYDYATELMNMLADRRQKEKCRSHEFFSLKRLVDMLMALDVSPELLDSFFFSFTIHQIGKEFDLLKLLPEQRGLNIELKSEPVELAEIEKQLRQNRYYLGFAAPDLRLFTFVASTGELYQLIGDTCYPVPLETLVEALPDYEAAIQEGIEELFATGKFLISPFTDPSRFLTGKYFLTQQQQDIREQVLEMILDAAGAPGVSETVRTGGAGAPGVSETVRTGEAAAAPGVSESIRTEGAAGVAVAAETVDSCRVRLGITGSTGSGKTLLLYDLARSIAREGIDCCVIHSGDLWEGHEYLNEHWDRVSLYSIKTLLPVGSDSDASETCVFDLDFSCIFVDEAHRLYQKQVDALLATAEKQGAALVFSYDNQQWLTATERSRNIPEYLQQLQGFREWSLSRRIRTGVEIAAFYRNMLDLSNTPRGEMDYSHIDVLFAADEEEAGAIAGFYVKYKKYYLPTLEETGSYTGQEYDNVLILVGGSIRYNRSGCMEDQNNPQGDLELDHRMYQNIPRTRSRLCILVVGNYALFQQIANIKYRMMERMYYRETILGGSLSGKEMTKLSRALKEAARQLPWEDGLIVQDTVDILQEQLTEAAPSRKILKNCIRFLHRIARDHPEQEGLQAAVQDYTACLSSISDRVYEWDVKACSADYCIFLNS
ncbi:MAG: ATP-binding protein [Lachnospiraceae bacterium]|nr:ATP-binding protein [Lachnospiraceae bacterium]